MKLFNNMPWKGWKTRKRAFIGVCLIWLIYAILGMVGVEIDTAFLDFIYKAGTWILGFGTSIVVSDKVAEILRGKESEEQ